MQRPDVQVLQKVTPICQQSAKVMFCHKEQNTVLVGEIYLTAKQKFGVSLNYTTLCIVR